MVKRKYKTRTGIDGVKSNGENDEKNSKLSVERIFKNYSYKMGLEPYKHLWN